MAASFASLTADTCEQDGVFWLGFREGGVVVHSPLVAVNYFVRYGS